MKWVLKNKKIIIVFLCLLLTVNQASSNIFKSAIKKVNTTSVFLSKNKKTLVVLTIIGSVALFIGACIFFKKKNRDGGGYRRELDDYTARQENYSQPVQSSQRQLIEGSEFIKARRLLRKRKKKEKISQEDLFLKKLEEEYSVSEQLEIERQIEKETKSSGINQAKKNNAQEEKVKDKYDQEECTSCCESLSGEKKVFKLGCEHLFHRECICNWLVGQGKKTCPVCRAEVSEDILKYLKKYYEPEEIDLEQVALPEIGETVEDRLRSEEQAAIGMEIEKEQQEIDEREQQEIELEKIKQKEKEERKREEEKNNRYEKRNQNEEQRNCKKDSKGLDSLFFTNYDLWKKRDDEKRARKKEEHAMKFKERDRKFKESFEESKKKFEGEENGKEGFDKFSPSMFNGIMMLDPFWSSYNKN